MAFTGTTKFTVTGIPAINRRLAQLEPKVRRAIERKAMRRAMLPVQRDAKSKVPRRTGALRSAIKLRSIAALPGRKKKTSKNWVGLSLFVGETTLHGVKAFYGKWMEFGAPRHRNRAGKITPLKPRSFMRWSFYKNADRAVKLMQALVQVYVLRAARGGSP